MQHTVLKCIEFGMFQEKDSVNRKYFLEIWTFLFTQTLLYIRKQGLKTGNGLKVIKGHV